MEEIKTIQKIASIILEQIKNEQEEKSPHDYPEHYRIENYKVEYNDFSVDALRAAYTLFKELNIQKNNEELKAFTAKIIELENYIKEINAYIKNYAGYAGCAPFTPCDASEA
jgi:hypothetical protein